MHSSWVMEGFNLAKKIRVVKPWKGTSFSRTINWWKLQQASSPNPSHQHLKFAGRCKRWHRASFVASFTPDTKVCIGFHVNPKPDRILVLPRVYCYNLSTLNGFCRTGVFVMCTFGWTTFSWPDLVALVVTALFWGPLKARLDCGSRGVLSISSKSVLLFGLSRFMPYCELVIWTSELKKKQQTKQNCFQLSFYHWARFTNRDTRRKGERICTANVLFKLHEMQSYVY